jgi:hypothetical protein
VYLSVGSFYVAVGNGSVSIDLNCTLSGDWENSGVVFPVNTSPMECGGK